MQAFIYKDQHDFAQAAFDHVAKVVFDHAEQIIVGGNMSTSSEQCLRHLERVVAQWGYNPVRVTAYAETIEQANNEIRELMDSWGENND